MTDALTAAEREEAQAELEALKEKRYLMSVGTGPRGYWRWLEAIERVDGEIARLEKLLAR